jgi:spore maturation protein CgeB
MKILCVFGRHNYGDPGRGAGYEYANFIPALRRLGHEVIHFESFDRSAYADFAELNRRLLNAVEREQPQMLFCVLMGYEIWLESLEMIKRNCGVLLVNWATDDSWKYQQFSRLVAGRFDIYATTSREAYAQSHCDGHKNFVLTQWAASAQTLAEPLPAADCRYAVSFIGSAYGNRPRWIAALKKQGIEVECFGHGWRNGPVSADEVPRIIRDSIISLNFGDSGWVLQGWLPMRSRQIKARVFEVPGAGGFLLTESAPDLDSFYLPDKEIGLFSGIEDLVLKITRYLSNPVLRDSMAQAGHNRTRLEHTYDQRFRTLFEAAMRPEPSSQARAGLTSTPVNRDIPARFSPEEVDKLERSYRCNRGLWMLRALLVFPCRIIWGPKRGARAARRLLFELSWRSVGARTYAARGLPGRLFYRES